MYTSHAMVTDHDTHLYKSGRDCAHVRTPGIDIIWVEDLYIWLKNLVIII